MAMADAGTTISVEVTRPDAYLAAGIAALLRSSPDVAVGLPPLHAESEDVVVTDYAAGAIRPPLVPFRPGRQACRRVVVTDHSGAWQTRRAIDSGACGYLLAHCSSAELTKAVRSSRRCS